MGGRHSTEVAFALPTQPSQVQLSAFPIQCYWDLSTAALLRDRVDSAKSLVVDQTHLVLVFGKLVVQKKISNETKLYLAFIAFFAFYTILTFYFKSSFFRNLVEIEIFDGISGENLKFHYFLIKFLRISLDLNLMPFI